MLVINGNALCLMPTAAILNVQIAGISNLDSMRYLIDLIMLFTSMKNGMTLTMIGYR